MVKHIVLFKLKGSDQERRRVAQAFVDALLRLPGQIPCLQAIEASVNQNPAETWDVGLEALLPTMADVEVYAKHPAHVAAASLLADHKEARACIDFNI